MSRFMRAGYRCLFLLIAATCLLPRPCVAGEPPGLKGQQPGAKDSRRTNILLIFTDDQSYKTVGCYPEAFPGVKTPNFDALAANGVRFQGAYLRRMVHALASDPAHGSVPARRRVDALGRAISGQHL